MDEKQKSDIKKRGIVIHHGTCDGCGERNSLIAHFKYPEGFNICPKCSGRALVAFGHPLMFTKKEGE